MTCAKSELQDQVELAIVPVEFARRECPAPLLNLLHESLEAGMMKEPQFLQTMIVERSPVEAVRIEAEQQLRENPHFFNGDLRCDFHEGVLILRGRVRSYYHKQIAQTIAAGVQGVGQVINHIEVGE